MAVLLHIIDGLINEQLINSIHSGFEPALPL